MLNEREATDISEVLRIEKEDAWASKHYGTRMIPIKRGDQMMMCHILLYIL